MTDQPETTDKTVRLNNAERYFISRVANDCLRHRISLNLCYQKHVIAPGEGEDMECGGFFSTDSRLLAVATDKPVTLWLSVLIHEYFHLRQWLEEPELFGQDDKEAEIFWDWIEGKCVAYKDTIKAIANRIMCWEEDCEISVLNYLRHNPEIRIDRERYAQAANAYLCFYPMIVKYQMWHNGTSPTIVDEILDTMPVEFPQSNDYYWSIPDKYERLVVKHCFGKNTAESSNQ